jgi:hypothetical protein
MHRGVNQVSDGLLWDWESNSLEYTCCQDQDVLDFVEEVLSYFEQYLMRRLEAEASELPDNELIDLVTRDKGLEYIPELAIHVQ